MTLLTIGPGTSFLDTLAGWWLDGSAGPEDVADGLILLPTRRAARALTEAFLRASEGRPLLLPRIVAFGALDETPLTLAGALDLPQAIPPLERLAALTRLVLVAERARGLPAGSDTAWRLARDLAGLLDEAHRSGVDLATALPDVAADSMATHWQQVVAFLRIVTEEWPRFLADRRLMDPGRRAAALLETQQALWEAEPPATRIVVAGTTGAVASVARLIGAVAGLPRGAVVLPALDLDLADDAWTALDDTHPQAGMRALLTAIGASRADVQRLGPAPDPPRAATLRYALLPAAALGRWRDPFEPAVDGIERLAPSDQQEEAVAVALALRDALETPHARAALVTPDRALALRVAAELARFGVIVDDSAGEALRDTPPAAFLRLLALAASGGLAPVALLAVLKHPFAAFGLAPASCRNAARRLERFCLRGPAPAPGMAGLRARLAERRPGDEVVLDLLDRVEHVLAPLAALPELVPPAEALAALLLAAERAATAPGHNGPDRLWALEEGEAMAAHLAALADALPHLPPDRLSALPGLLDASMEGAIVRSRRALRGREGEEHPRVAILGLLEARLQSFDVLILGGLAETVWPEATDPGPWMSRPMRASAGLPSPEEAVGQTAHDFFTLACAAPSVILSCPARRDGAPAVPARWLVRLEKFLAGHGAALARHPASVWAAQLDQPADPPRPVAPPQPRPPVSLRPRRLSVTEIETWLRDPYAIYAKHVLDLRALDPLEQSADAADYGTIVHAAVSAFVAGLPDVGYPADAASRLRAAMDQALAARALRPALAAWWQPRLHRIADWLAEQEAARRRQAPPLAVACERSGDWSLESVTFRLTGRADRIERKRDGTLAILDYKTGRAPEKKHVRSGRAPQLTLEAAMAAAGAFGPDVTGMAAELAYWRLTGGFPPGEISEPFAKDAAALPAAIDEARAALLGLVEAFDDPARAYLSEPHPDAAPRFSDYAQLARVAEWSVAEEPE